ncbi:alpha/beta hydrolase [Actinocorallia lasiicapitis]
MRLPVLVALLLVATSCTGVPAAAPPLASPTARVDFKKLERFYAQKPRWSKCGKGKKFDCADVKVPLDYTDPDGRTMEIAVNRLRASGKRLGSLLVNPGGPGASGKDFVYSAAAAITAPVRERYTIVGFDPRGVGDSNGIRCLDDDQLDRFYLTDSTPDTRWESGRLRTMSRRYAEECQSKSGWLLPYLGTANVARDMDVIRAALGEKKTNYLGYSYGTQLGQVYAELFPGRVRRMVLDSVVDSALWAGRVWDSQLTSLDAQFDLFLDSCVRHGCPLGTSRTAASRRLWKLLGSTDVDRLKGHGRDVSDTDVHTAVVVLAMNPALWSLGRTAFADALRGDGRTLQALAEAGRGRNPVNGRYDSTIAANLAVRCLETPQKTRIEAASDKRIDWMSDRSPLFAEINTTLACSYWKVPALPQHTITPKGVAPVLLLGNTNDPRTPLAWAKAVTARFPGARLVVNRADGHIVYGRGACVNRAVEDYLLTGKQPRDGLECRDSGPRY